MLCFMQIIHAIAPLVHYSTTIHITQLDKVHNTREKKKKELLKTTCLYSFKSG